MKGMSSNLGAEGKRNIEPRANDPGARGVQRPEGAGDHVEDRCRRP